jgi:alkane 1-monooxygenase
MTTAPTSPFLPNFTAALPFWLSLLLIPLAVIAAVFGGWTLLLLPLATWYLFSILDYFTGLNENNPDPQTPDTQLYWYKLITLIWTPFQLITIFGLMVYTVNTDHLNALEEWVLFAGFGVISGTVGINYSHELMHQKSKLERWMGDILLASVLYSHFRSEHLLVHHRYVATPKDPVTARFNEHFWRFLPRVLRQCYISAFNAEKGMLARKKKPWTDLSNPFFRYWALQAAFVILAAMIGGWWGV